MLFDECDYVTDFWWAALGFEARPDNTSGLRDAHVREWLDALLPARCLREKQGERLGQELSVL